MQLGSSLSNSNNGKFTICAAGTLNLNFKDHYPNGQCWFGNYNQSFLNSNNYLSDNNDGDEIEVNNLFNLNPLNDTKRQIYENTYFFSHGMFGFSSKISKVCVYLAYFGQLILFSIFNHFDDNYDVLILIFLFFILFRMIHRLFSMGHLGFMYLF